MADRMSRDEYRKQKEIEEARKAGTLPPEVDNDGNMINPHIPEYMSKAPWYLNQDEGAGLKHQRFALEQAIRYDDMSKARIKGFTYRATKFRKGACQNCGSMTHTKKDCVERPRRRGAKLTGKDIRPDEIMPNNLTLTWDGKRDRWAGYDNNEHQRTINKYKLADEERRRKRKAKMDRKSMLAAEVLCHRLAATFVPAAQRGKSRRNPASGRPPRPDAHRPRARCHACFDVPFHRRTSSQRRRCALTRRGGPGGAEGAEESGPAKACLRTCTLRLLRLSSGHSRHGRRS